MGNIISWLIFGLIAGAIAKLLMPNITTEAINALAESYITNENRVIIITAPTAEKSSLPTENEIQNIIKSIDTKNIEAYKDATSNEPLIAEELKETSIKVNAVCPGWVKTDMGGPHAERSLSEGIRGIVWAATLSDTGPTGGFFRDGEKLDW